MGDGNPGPMTPRRPVPEPAVARREPYGHGNGASVPAGVGTGPSGMIIETVVSPFHCLYQDALHFHTQSQLSLSRSEGEASRMARASLLLYLAGAEALVHQAAVELGRPDLASLLADPLRPLPLADAWRLLPAIVAGGVGPASSFDPDRPPWPQFAELLAMRTSWAYPGPPPARRAYYHAADRDAAYEPLEPHQAPRVLGLSPEALHYPRTGLPRDPYALRPRHLDTARSILDAAIAALDQRLGGALTQDQRHRREPVRPIEGSPPRQS